MLLEWLMVIEPPTLLYWPLKVTPVVAWMLMVTVSEVSVPVLLIFTPSSLKKALLELITVVSVTPPVPVPVTALTVTATVVVADNDPLVPVTVTFVVPATAVLEAVNVTVSVLAAEPATKVGVTPVGNPLAL